MTKQKPPSSLKTITTALAKRHIRLLHARRALWFAVLAAGLLLIQFASTLHSNDQPQVLGYTVSSGNSTLLQDTNEYRHRENLPSLSLNDVLSRAAQAKADSMIAQNYWSHVAPDGTQPWHYFKEAGYSYAAAGENLAYGFTSADQIVTAWMNSPEHRNNILGDYKDVGFGIARSDNYQQGKNTVVVAFYGRPGDAQILPASTSSNSLRISGLTTIMSGNAPWATYASLALLGATIVGFIVTHMDTLRLGWHNTRRYAVLHPAADAAVLLGVSLIIVQAAGGFIR